MLNCKLPTKASPPKMSIHWTSPYPDKDIAEKQEKEKLKKLEDFSYYDETWRGKEPDFANARGFIYHNDRVRIFPHEFSEVSNKNLQLYLNEGVYKLIHVKALAQLLDVNLSKEKRVIYEAALLDGCDHYQAMMIALGQDPIDTFPPIGWFKLTEEYANYFCYANEQEG